jgi:hypothetical protein
MRKVKVKKVKMSLGQGDEDLAAMFNKMIGADAVDIDIALPRFTRIRFICAQLVKLFRVLHDSPFMSAFPEFSLQAAQIDKFCNDAAVELTELFNIDFLGDTTAERFIESLDDADRKAFTAQYNAVKRSNIVKTFIILCDRLVPYKKNFINLDALNHKFITNMAGTEWAPFPFTTLNIKHVFALDGIGKNTIGFFMTILHKSYELSRQLYEEIQSPDINVDHLVDVIMTNIDLIQKRPELNRCGEAFKKIKESVSLLKNRLNGYYRDFIATSDSTIMMQHFIIDVSKETKADATVIRQFGIIVKYYRKIAQDQITDPRVKMLFDKINESFKDLDKETKNLVNIHDETSAAPTEDLDSDPLCVTAMTEEQVLHTAAHSGETGKNNDEDNNDADD